MTPEYAEQICQRVGLVPFETVAFDDMAAAIDGATNEYLIAWRRKSQVSEAARRDGAKRVSARAVDLLASLGFTAQGKAIPEQITPGLGIGGLATNDLRFLPAFRE